LELESRTARRLVRTSAIGGAAAGFDADVARLTGQFHPIRSGEAVLELTYQFQLTGWWRLQPDFQYIFNPASVLSVTISPGPASSSSGHLSPIYAERLLKFQRRRGLHQGSLAVRIGGYEEVHTLTVFIAVSASGRVL
jgi:hypothetical protein